uniref:ARAD1D13574p n=1 Tax=Blastobotrys adeninivorans TaxID=409370 RepID=A0A060T9Q1_BLAAD
MSGRDSFVPSNNAAAMSMAAQGLNAHRNYGVRYICSNCAADVTLNKADPVRCKECGHRVLYKQRTTRMVQFEAR